MKDIGKMHHFLGIRIVQNDSSGDIWIGQPVYVNKLLMTFKMENAKSVSMPVDTSVKLTKADSDERFDRNVYQSMVGRLLYLL